MLNLTALKRNLVIGYRKFKLSDVRKDQFNHKIYPPKANQLCNSKKS